MVRASRRTLAGAAALAVVLCGTALAAAENADAGRSIAAARAALADLRLEAAIALVTPLVSSAEARSRLDALSIRATARLLAGDAVGGARDVADVYALAPAYSVDDPSLPPRVTRVFEAEAARPHARAITIAVRPDESDPGAFRVSTSLRAARLAFSCRAQASTGYLPIVTLAQPGGSFRAQLPTLRGYECYALALDEEGLPLGALGARAAPFTLEPHRRDPPPTGTEGVVSKWWFWSSVGIVVAAAAVTSVVLVESHRQPAPPPADITVPARGASFSW